MSLKSKLRLKGVPPAVVTVEAGEDLLELHVSRQDLSAALLKRMRDKTKRWEGDDTPDDELPEEQQLAKSLDQTEGAAIFVCGVVLGYRILPKDGTDEDLAAVRRRGLHPLTVEDLMDLPPELMGEISTKVQEAINPNSPPSAAA